MALPILFSDRHDICLQARMPKRSLTGHTAFHRLISSVSAHQRLLTFVQTFILTYWQKVDQPLTRRLVKTIVDSEQIRLNGLVARGYLLGASVQFLEEENPLTDLLNGIFRVHTYITPPVPAEQIEDVLEYDVNNFRALFND